MPATIRFRSLAALLTAGALALGGAVACSGDGEDDPDLTIYSGRNEGLVGDLFAQFEDETGIRVRVEYGSTSQLAAQLLEERDRSPADVFYAQDAGALGAVANAGLLATLPDDVRDQVPAGLQARGGEWVGVTGRARVLVYHRDQVDTGELPDSVLELTEPQWRGRVGIAPTNASFQAFVTAMRVQHGDDATRDWLEGMVANDPQIRENNNQIVADVNDGRIDTGLVNHYYVYARAREDGTTVDALAAQNHYFTNGDIGGLINVSGVGVLAHAAENPDAQTFVSYLLSMAGQTYFAQNTAEYPMGDAVPSPEGAPDLSTVTLPDIDLNELDTLAETVTMLTEVGLA